MPYPATGAEVRRPDLEGVLEEFNVQADREGFIATRVLPVLDVPVDSGKYQYVPLEELLQKIDGLERAPGSAYAVADLTWREALYSTQELGVEVPVDDKMNNRYPDFEMEAAATKFARDIVLRNIEQAVVTQLVDTAVFAHEDVTIAWDVSESAHPVADINEAVEAFFAASGEYPNKLIINRRVARNLLYCNEVQEQWKGIKSTAQGNMTAEDLASAFGLHEVLIAGGTQNLAERGQTRDLSPIWPSDYAMLVRVASDARNPFDPGVGRLLHYSADGSVIGGTIESYRVNETRGNRIRCRIEATPKIIYPTLGYLLGGITTPAG